MIRNRLLLFLGAVPIGLFALEWSGEIELTRGYFYQDSLRQVDYLYDRALLLAENSRDDYSLRASFDLRIWDAPKTDNLSRMTLLDYSYPYQLTLWEAYGEIYDFPFPNLDLTIGKQRIAWGTADNLNPTDNLNPLDFQDPLDFGKRVPSEAVAATYYPQGVDWSFSAIWLPIFHPTLLPRAEFPLWAPRELEGFDIVEIRDSIQMPSQKLEDSQWAMKVSGRLVDVDFSLSYFRGYDGFPLEEYLSVYTPLTSLQDSGLRATLLYTLSFPKVQVGGFDFSGEFKTLGFWGEFAYWIPEEFHLKEESPSIGFGAPYLVKDTLLLKDPFLKFTLGADYTFNNGPYINLQWMHGFYTERGKDLHDYAVGRIEKKLLDERLQIALGGIFEVADWDSLSRNYGYALNPELTYWPRDNVEIELGLFSLNGNRRALLGLWKDKDQVYLRTTLNF